MPNNVTLIEDGVRKMAHRFYGYGRWDAPFWFIGPEQGQGRDENNDLMRRAEAWLHLGGSELCDCREFHNSILQKKWHSEKARLQPTWRRLILLLMAFLERPKDSESLRSYQRDRWGMVSGGETCVIELSGLAANSLEVLRDRELFRDERIEIIRQRMDIHKPTFVLMYGAKQKPSWEKLAGCSFPSSNIVTVGSTSIAFAPHPISRGRQDDYWVELGKTLREQTKRP